MFFQRTCRSFYYLRNKNRSEGRSMMHPWEKKERNHWRKSLNSPSCQGIALGKTMSRMSIKCRCQRSFIAKQLYLDHNLCQLIYLHALGSQLSNAMKTHLKHLLKQRLSHAQVMTHHKSYVKEQAQWNELVTHDTFILPLDVRNLASSNFKWNKWQTHIVSFIVRVHHGDHLWLTCN